MTKVFPNARDNRTLSRDNLLLYYEIRGIEEAILLAQRNNKLSAIVENTIMTDVPEPMPSPEGDEGIEFPTSMEYYLAWKGHIDRPELRDQMDSVIKHFKDLNYSIRRKTNAATLDTFVWEVKW